MLTKEDSLRWLQRCTKKYRSGVKDICESVEDLDNLGKLGQGFASIDELHELDIGDGNIAKPTYLSSKLTSTQKAEVCELFKEFVDCFAWEYLSLIHI